MITPVGFDPGGVEFARSKGIGLCRLIPCGSLVWLMEDSSEAKDSDILRALTTPDTTAFRSYGFFYGRTKIYQNGEHDFGPPTQASRCFSLRFSVRSDDSRPGLGFF